MIILGADLATSTGICWGRPRSAPRAYAVRAPVTGDDLGLWGTFWLRAFARVLDDVTEALEPDEELLVCYEAPVTIEKKWDPSVGKMVGGNPIATTRKLQSLGVLLETACALRDIEIDVRECHLSSIKKLVTGKGKADKSMMVLAARRAGISLPDGPEAHDAADAFGAWLYAIYHRSPADMPFWDQRLHGRILG